jgi:uncharacterized membrane protein YbhN (UPF0104 family)
VTGLGEWAVFGIAALLLALLAAYFVLCATLRRPFRLFRWTIEMPGPRLAFGQLLVGTVNFACVAACLHQIVSAVAETSYLSVATVYVLATAATVVTHAPGGLGVIESVVLHLLPEAQLIGAVLAFRFAYFLLPLCLGAGLFAIVELRHGALRWKDEPATHEKGSERRLGAVAPQKR